MELFACRLDHLDLIDLGQAHVDIEDIGALLLLADALGHHVVEVAVAQGLLQALFARGIDALADDGDAMARDGKGNAALRACDVHGGVVMAQLWRASFDELPEQAHVVGRGAAASSHNAYAVFDHFGDSVGIFGRVDVKDGIAFVVYVRQAGICLYEHGFVGNVEHAFCKGTQVGRPLTAVDAYDVCS